MNQRLFYFVFLILCLLGALSVPAQAHASIYMEKNPPASVRIDSDIFRAAIESGLLSQLTALGVNVDGQNEHWIDDFQINEYGEIVEVTATSLFRVQVTATSEKKDVLCDSTWGRYVGVWMLKSAENVLLCELQTEAYPLSSKRLSKHGWFSQSSPVDRKTFESIYTEFRGRLVLLDVYSPSWVGEAWILRGSIDSTMYVRNVWIFASALVDRYAIDVERRAECHGEGFWDEFSGWRAVKPASCRLQDYRHIQSCAGDMSSICEWEWVPCDGDACLKP